MFDKELFYSLCEKYQVELSEEFDRPMIKDGDTIKPLTDTELLRVFEACQSFFQYSLNKKSAKVIPLAYTISMLEDLAEAC